MIKHAQRPSKATHRSPADWMAWRRDRSRLRRMNLGPHAEWGPLRLHGRIAPARLLAHEERCDGVKGLKFLVDRPTSRLPGASSGRRPATSSGGTASPLRWRVAAAGGEGQPCRILHAAVWCNRGTGGYAVNMRHAERLEGRWRAKPGNADWDSPRRQVERYLERQSGRVRTAGR